VLEQGTYDRLALANPLTAPYGLAAREFLTGAGLWDSASARAVFGENIAQTLQFVATGNATLGLIAMPQSMDPRLPAATCTWVVPASTHAPLHQQSVLLIRASGNDGARRFMEFLESSAAKKIIGRDGYQVFD
jgi:molybdate transport system substrate-binding protein